MSAFRSMTELHHTDPVDMLLGDGRVVTGWLFCGMPNTPRSYWTNNERGSSLMIEPVGWREPPCVGDASCAARKAAA